MELHEGLELDRIWVCKPRELHAQLEGGASFEGYLHGLLGVLTQAKEALDLQLGVGHVTSRGGDGVEDNRVRTLRHGLSPQLDRCPCEGKGAKSNVRLPLSTFSYFGLQARQRHEGMWGLKLPIALTLCGLRRDEKATHGCAGGKSEAQMDGSLLVVANALLLLRRVSGNGQSEGSRGGGGKQGQAGRRLRRRACVRDDNRHRQ